MEIIDTFHEGCNVDNVEGAGLLIVLTVGAVEDYAAYRGIVRLPDVSGPSYQEAREKAAWRVAGGGIKLRATEAVLKWPWLKDKEYRA